MCFQILHNRNTKEENDEYTTQLYHIIKRVSELTELASRYNGEHPFQLIEELHPVRISSRNDHYYKFVDFIYTTGSSELDNNVCI